MMVRTCLSVVAGSVVRRAEPARPGAVAVPAVGLHGSGPESAAARGSTPSPAASTAQVPARFLVLVIGSPSALLATVALPAGFQR